MLGPSGRPAAGSFTHPAARTGPPACPGRAERPRKGQEDPPVYALIVKPRKSGWVLHKTARSWRSAQALFRAIADSGIAENQVCLSVRSPAEGRRIAGDLQAGKPLPAGSSTKILRFAKS